MGSGALHSWKEPLSRREGGTYHRSQVLAIQHVCLSGHRPQRSWPLHRRDSSCRQHRSTHQSDSCAGRAGGSRLHGRPQIWRMSRGHRLPRQTWLERGKGEEKVRCNKACHHLQADPQRVLTLKSTPMPASLWEAPSAKIHFSWLRESRCLLFFFPD